MFALSPACYDSTLVHAQPVINGFCSLLSFPPTAFVLAFITRFQLGFSDDQHCFSGHLLMGEASTAIPHLSIRSGQALRRICMQGQSRGLAPSPAMLLARALTTYVRPETEISDRTALCVAVLVPQCHWYGRFVGVVCGLSSWYLHNAIKAYVGAASPGRYTNQSICAVGLLLGTVLLVCYHRNSDLMHTGLCNSPVYSICDAP